MYRNIPVVVVAILAIVVARTEAARLVPRVVGGAAIGDRCRAPYNSMVALEFDADFSPVVLCSAVMLTDTYLVTTAQCLLTIAEMNARETGPRRAVAAIGESDTVMKNEEEEQRIDIKSFKAHFRYDADKDDNNIGLIELARPAKLGRCVKPAFRMEKDPAACLDVDESCQVVGWGAYTESPTPFGSRLPRAAAATVYSDLVTYLLSTSSGNVAPLGTVFAETQNPFQKPCFFDWGGIVSCKRNGHNVLRGILGDHNCNTRTQRPFKVVDISYYQYWIDQCIKNWKSCPALGHTTTSAPANNGSG